MKKWVCILILTFASLSGMAQHDTLTADAGRRYELLFHEAMLQRQKGNHDATFDLLTRCLQLRPEASEAWYFLAQYYNEMRQSEKALECFKQAASLEPANMTYMETLAQAYIAGEQYAEAITVVEKMYDNDKSRQELLQTLYSLYTRQEEYRKAIGVLDRMEAIDGRSERTALTKSVLYNRLEENDKALAEVKALATEHPNDLSYKTIYANALMMDDQMDEALRLLRQVLAEEPDNTRAQTAMRAYYLYLDDTLAVDSVTRLILLNPRTATDDKVYQLRQMMAESEQAGGDSTRVLGIMHEMLAQPEPDPNIAALMAAYMDLKQMPRDSVSRALEFVLQLAPDHAQARLQLVQYAWEANDDRRIISLCQEAREYNPEEMAFYYYQGMAYYRQEDTDHALEAFQNGINVITDESSPEIVSDFYAVMGDLLFQKNRQREAFEAYDSCLQWKPDNIGCLNNYAYYLSLNNKRLDEAEEMSYKTIKASPKNATYLDTYAWILFMQGRYAEARVYIDQAIQNDSTASAVITEHAGDIHALSGDIEGALDLWQQALGEDPGNKLLARKIKRKKYIKQ